MLAYFLCYTFARSAKMKSLPASLLVTALLLFNNPLMRTLKHNQINLWMLDLFLLAILFLQRYPLISGLEIALGGHLKLYPLILLLPWGITKQWRAVVGALVSFFSIMMIQTNWGQNWELWHYFIAYFGVIQKPTAFRNNSLYSIFYNFFKMAGLPTDSSILMFT